ncbi:hypothetical protein PCANC_16107 [Puccinia coronata f. sp. avenae]|uniref:Uncharacterized protein n=1 Tax=Puccinia coronata f. sp. avenae TaxID=200324 RepID=A0A2N5UEC9_9BASI|nr:hypothetical protein PCANC_16107 [Puccinia coronata f. sp. avenae]
MKFAEILLLSVTEFVISCRGNFQDQFQAHNALSMNSWSGETSQQLMEGIHHRFTSSSSYDPYSRITNEPTPSRSNSVLPDHFMTEDHAVRPPNYHQHVEPSPGETTSSWPDNRLTNSVMFSTPIHSFENTPLDDDFFKSLPSAEEYVDYFPDGWKTADEWSGLTASSNNEVSRVARGDVSLLDRIHLSEEEKRVHQLIFHSDVLKIPKSGYQLHTSRKTLFEDIWAQRKAESGSILPGLMIKNDELEELANDFNRLQAQGGRVEDSSPSILARLALVQQFFPLAETWIDVYHSRLGIDFEAVRKWAKEICAIAPIISRPQTAEMVTQSTEFKPSGRL